MATFIWTNGAGNYQWEEPSNWDQGSGWPGYGDDARFEYQTTLVVTCSGQVYANITLVQSGVSLNNCKVTAQSGSTVTIRLEQTSSLAIYGGSSTDASLYADTFTSGGSFSLQGDTTPGANFLTITGWSNPGSVTIEDGLVVNLTGDNTAGTASVSITDGAVLNVTPSTAYFPRQNWNIIGGTLYNANSYAAFAANTTIALGSSGTLSDSVTTWDSTMTLNWYSEAGTISGNNPAGQGVNQQLIGSVYPSQIAAYLGSTDTLSLVGGTLNLQPVGATINYNLDAIASGSSLLF